MRADPPTPLLGAWRCPAARSVVHARFPSASSNPDLTVGSLGERGEAAGRAECILVGEITDLSRLRSALRAPADGSVADLLARGYAERGPGILAFLRGAWVLALWDTRRRAGLLAVDPMGARGLHYAWRQGGLVFGEEARDVLTLLEHTPEPDRAQTLLWLMEGTFQPDGALFSGIQRLVGGTALLLGAGPPRVHTYWRAGGQLPLDVGREEAAMLLRDEVDRAVADASGSGKVGVLLSGGLDSSTVAASVVANGAASRLTAYSGYFPDDAEADERSLIDETVEVLGLRHVAVEPRPTSALAAALPLISTWQLPLNSGMGFVWAGLLERVVADGNAVLLDGEGGDELFVYDMSLLLTEQLRRGRFADAWRTSASGQRLVNPTLKERAAFASDTFRTAVPDWARALRRRVRSMRGHGLPPFDERTVRAVRSQPDPLQWRQRTDGPLWHRSLAFELTDLRFIMDAQGFSRREGASFGFWPGQPLHSDPDLIELVLRLPARLHLDPTRDRPLARDMNTTRLPAAVLQRTEKSHFSNAFVEAMTTTDAAAIRQLLCGPAPLLAEYVSADRIRSFVDAPPAGSLSALDDWAGQLWQLAACEIWLQSLSA